MDRTITNIKKTYFGALEVTENILFGLNKVDINNADFILRGLRNVSYFEFEKNIALTNRKLSGIETVFLLTSAKNSFISSGIVRDLIKNNGDYSLFIPEGLDIK